MTFALFAACGLLIAVAGAIASVMTTRRSIAKLPDAFTCKVLVNRRGFRRGQAWPHRSSRGVWVHDSLVLVSGLFRVRVRPLLVRFAEGALEDAPLGAVRGLGHNPVLLSLELDDDVQVLLAAPRSAASVVTGPYFVALVTSTAGLMGRAPIEKPPPGML